MRMLDGLRNDGEVFDAVLDTVGGKRVWEAAERLLRVCGAGSIPSAAPSSVQNQKRYGNGQFTTVVGDNPSRVVPSAGDHFRAGLRSWRIGGNSSERGASSPPSGSDPSLSASPDLGTSPSTGRMHHQRSPRSEDVIQESDPLPLPSPPTTSSIGPTTLTGSPPTPGLLTVPPQSSSVPSAMSTMTSLMRSRSTRSTSGTRRNRAPPSCEATQPATTILTSPMCCRFRFACTYPNNHQQPQQSPNSYRAPTLSDSW